MKEELYIKLINIEMMIHLSRTQFVSKTYFKDLDRVQDEIWEGINVREKVVIDVGIGESTKRLIKLSARVIGVENDLQKIVKYKDLRIPILMCDFFSFPFQKRIADFVVFYFTLHEIDQKFHTKAVSIAGKLAPRVVIVEPSPIGCSTYEKFAVLWKRAMHSIGRFEDYKPAEYWKELLKEAGFEIVMRKIDKWKIDLPTEVLRNIVEATVKEWSKAGVRREYINELKRFLREKPKMR